LLDALLNLLFPAGCVLCDKPVLEWNSGALCPDCVAKLRRPESPVCVRCGSWGPVGNTSCAACLTGETRFDLARHALVFDEPVRMAVHHFKYNGRVSLARPLGRCLRACLREHPFSARIAVPVPLDRRRERRRGYNQAALLAAHLGLEMRPDLIRRVRETGTQTGLTKRQRELNVRNAFQCAGSVPGTVLVVDDVLTTGATIGEVAKALKRSGASRVEVLTLTRVGQLTTGAR
jgi:ComF family protein